MHRSELLELQSGRQRFYRLRRRRRSGRRSGRGGRHRRRRRPGLDVALVPPAGRVPRRRLDAAAACRCRRASASQHRRFELLPAAFDAVLDRCSAAHFDPPGGTGSMPEGRPLVNSAQFWLCGLLWLPARPARAAATDARERCQCERRVDRRRSSGVSKFGGARSRSKTSSRCAAPHAPARWPRSGALLPQRGSIFGRRSVVAPDADAAAAPSPHRGGRRRTRRWVHQRYARAHRGRRRMCARGAAPAARRRRRRRRRPATSSASTSTRRPPSTGRSPTPPPTSRRRSARGCRTSGSRRRAATSTRRAARRRCGTCGWRCSCCAPRAAAAARERARRARTPSARARLSVDAPAAAHAPPARPPARLAPQVHDALDPVPRRLPHGHRPRRGLRLHLLRRRHRRRRRGGAAAAAAALVGRGRNPVQSGFDVFVDVCFLVDMCHNFRVGIRDESKPMAVRVPDATCASARDSTRAIRPRVPRFRTFCRRRAPPRSPEPSPPPSRRARGLSERNRLRALPDRAAVREGLVRHGRCSSRRCPSTVRGRCNASRRARGDVHTGAASRIHTSTGRAAMR